MPARRLRILRDGAAGLAGRGNQVHHVQAALRVQQDAAIEVFQRDVAQLGGDLVARHGHIHAGKRQALPVQEVVVVDAVLQVHASDVDAALPVDPHGRIAGCGGKGHVALGTQRDGAHGGVQAAGRIGRERRHVQVGQVYGRRQRQRLRRERALHVQRAVALDARGRQGEITFTGAHGQAVRRQAQRLQGDVQRGLLCLVARLELGQVRLDGRGVGVDGAALFADMDLGRRAQPAIQQQDRCCVAHGRGPGRQGNVAHPHGQLQRQRFQFQRPLGADPAAVGAVVHVQPQVDGLVLDLGDGHAFNGGAHAGHDVVQLADRVGQGELAFVQVEGVQRDFPVRRVGGGGRRGGGSTWGNTRGGRRRSCGRRRGWRGIGNGCPGSIRNRFHAGAGFRLVLQPHVPPQLVGHRRLGGRHARQRLQLDDDVLPVQVFIGVAAHMDLRRPQADLAYISLARDRFQFQAGDGQRAPGGQGVAVGVAQVKPAQAQITHHANLGRGVLGLFKHHLQVGVQQRAFQLERQRHGPDVRPLFKLQAVERNAQGRRRHLVERARHAGQVEGAAVDAQVQPGLHVDVGGVAEVGNERDTQAKFIHHLLAPGDLVIQRDGPALDDHIVQRKTGQAGVGLGWRFRLGRRHVGDALLDVGKIEARDVFTHDGNARLAQRQPVNDGREPEQGAPGGAGIQLGQCQQRGLRTGLRHGKVAGAYRQGEGVEADLAHGNIAADHLGDVGGQHVVQDLRHLPGGDAAEDQRKRHNAQ
ncbi:hypothetical protein D3C86_728770 [compost metagenome]